MSAAEHYVKAEDFLSRAEEEPEYGSEQFGYFVELSRLHTELALANAKLFPPEIDEFEDLRP